MNEIELKQNDYEIQNNSTAEIELNEMNIERQEIEPNEMDIVNEIEHQDEITNNGTAEIELQAYEIEHQHEITNNNTAAIEWHDTDDEVDDNSKEELKLNADIDWTEIEFGKNDEIADNSKADNDIELHRNNDEIAIEHELDANLKAVIDFVEIQLNDETRKRRQYYHDERLLNTNEVKAHTVHMILILQSRQIGLKNKLMSAMHSGFCSTASYCRG
jgi:hypothetical protein